MDKMRLFKVKTKSECPFILGGNYCDHPDGPYTCQGDDWPDGCPGEEVEEDDK